MCSGQDHSFLIRNKVEMVVPRIAVANELPLPEIVDPLLPNVFSNLTPIEPVCYLHRSWGLVIYGQKQWSEGFPDRIGTVSRNGIQGFG